ncbi:MAG: hypothetical protein RL410_767 [Actinomycetota bacterium]|jgi:hypothetical protein
MNHVDVARAAVRDIADATEIGDFVRTDDIESTQVVRFASTHPGYVGWLWSVALSGDPATVDEVWLEPTEASLIATPWTPWSERVQPGDLAAGDLLPTAPDDPRLLPGFTGADVDADIEELTPAAWTIGLGRERILSPLGIDDAVDRWREGSHGPRAAVARYADLPCSTCGWLITIGGRLGQGFGVCANALSPSDGHIVAMDHGCGGHSETVVETGVVPVSELVIDELGHFEIDRNDLPEPISEVVPGDDGIFQSDDDVNDVIADSDETVVADVTEVDSTSSHDE